MKAHVDVDGLVRQVKGKAGAEATFTTKDAGDTEKLARTVQELRRDVAALKRARPVRVVDFEDVPVDNSGTTIYRLRHGFGGRVRWWVLGCRQVPSLAEHSTASTEDELVLLSYVAGTASIRVEAAG